MKPVPPEQVDELLMQHPLPLPDMDCPLEKCAGRVVLEDLATDRPQPPFSRSMMDGYAVRSEDVSGPLKVVGKVWAGEPAEPLPDASGIAVEIATGAPVPEGTDRIVPYEDVERKGDVIQIQEDSHPGPGNWIHAEGSDADTGQVLVKAGTTLGARELSAAASVGQITLTVKRLPRIALISTGNETIPVEETPTPFQIRRSNAVSVAAVLAMHQFNAATSVHLADDEAQVHEAVADLSASHDLIISCGGISKGKQDYLPGALEAAGFEALFRRVLQKPGQPMGYWVSETCHALTLPGNPLSVLCGIHRHGLPLIRFALGDAQAFVSPLGLTLEDPMPESRLVRYLPVKQIEGGKALPMPVGNSGDWVRILDSDGFLRVSPEGGTGPFPFTPWS